MKYERRDDGCIYAITEGYESLVGPDVSVRIEIVSDFAAWNFEAQRLNLESHILRFQQKRILMLDGPTDPRSDSIRLSVAIEGCVSPIAEEVELHTEVDDDGWQRAPLEVLDLDGIFKRVLGRTPMPGTVIVVGAADRANESLARLRIV